jgi:hypothetical protein
LFGLTLRKSGSSLSDTSLSDASPNDSMVRMDVAGPRTDTAPSTFYGWMFWVNGGLHVLFLVAALAAIFRW